MFRFVFALVAVCLCADVSLAQLFPNAPWNTRSQSSNCPGGVCPDRGAASASHWTYPGTISNHLEGAHGVPTSGMSRQQMLNLHDSLHEGTAPTMKQSLPAPYASYSAPLPQAVKSYGSTGGYGSSGSSFRVGSVMPDGAVVVSIGSTLDPAIAQAAAAGVEALAIGDRRDFRKSLLEAARKARQAGEITPMEYFALSAASRNPRVLEKMQAAVHEAAIEEGLASTQAIDWSSLIDFIEKLIPIIIKLIDLFS